MERHALKFKIANLSRIKLRKYSKSIVDNKHNLKEHIMNKHHSSFLLSIFKIKSLTLSFIFFGFVCLFCDPKQANLSGFNFLN